MKYHELFTEIIEWLLSGQCMVSQWSVSGQYKVTDWSLKVSE